MQPHEIPAFLKRQYWVLFAVAAVFIPRRYFIYIFWVSIAVLAALFLFLFIARKVRERQDRKAIGPRPDFPEGRPSPPA